MTKASERFYSVWHYTGGEQMHIGALLSRGSHRIEAWGNSREGFSPFLVSGDSGVEVGFLFRRLRDLRAEAARLFDCKVAIGRNFPA